MSSLGVIGELTESKRVEWKIPNFSTLYKDVGCFYESPHFTFADTSLYFRMYPLSSGKNKISLSVYLIDEAKQSCVVTISLQKSDGMLVGTRTVASTTLSSHGCCNFFDASDLKKLLPADILTISCDLKLDKDEEKILHTTEDNSLKEKASHMKLTGLIFSFDLNSKTFQSKPMVPVVLGKIVEVEKHEKKQIKWKITDFFTIIGDEYDDEDVCIDSPIFCFSDASWYFRLYKEHECELVEVYLNIKTNPKYSVEYYFGLVNQDGSVGKAVKGIKTIENSTSIDFYLSEVKQLNSGFVPSGILTVMCTLKYEASHSTHLNVLGRQKSKTLIKLDTLSQNFKDLFANKDSCDAILQVKDKEYKAHKAILIARSPVFAPMFLHDTSEKQTGIIKIPDCDPDTFGEFLEFLYCGKIEEISSCSAISLYETSDKYNIQELKTFCCDHLMENLTAQNLYDAVTLADKYDDEKLLSAIQKFFNGNFNDIVQISEWEHLMKSNYRLANKLLKGMPKIASFKV